LIALIMKVINNCRTWSSSSE